MKHITIGVAGHVDHGKTALVRALTGMETDRLAEEQQRGMSIVLGFAHLTLPEGEVDLIDVPGHEKFVRTMIAGATGIEAVLLVVAAGEGVKPQTGEHLALTELLGVRRGIVVVSKSDLVPESSDRELVAAEMRDFLQETFLRDAPLVFASSVTGEGLDELTAGLRRLLTGAEIAPETDDFTLPIDRVFSVTGHGAVVTGTLRRGALRVGQTVELLPHGTRAEVRGMQVHGRAVETASPGRRVAVNLRGVKQEALERGDALAAPGYLRPTRQFDAQVTVLATAARPVKRGQSVRLHYGARESVARVFPLGRDEIAPGEAGFVQFRTDEEAFLPVRERFIVRSLSPAETVGGGTVLDSVPARHRRGDAGALARVQALARGDIGEMLRETLREAGPQGLDLARFARDWGAAPETIGSELAALHAVLCPGGLALGADFFADLCRSATETVTRFHARHPTLAGMPREELRQKLSPGLPPSVFAHVLSGLVAEGHFEAADGLVREASFSSEERLSPAERAIAQEIAERFRGDGLRPPNLSDVLGTDRRKKNLYHFLVRTGVLVPAVDRTNNRTVVFHRDALTEAERVLASHLPTTDGLTVSEINDVLKTTRKNSIPLLELLDLRGVTRASAAANVVRL